MLTDTPIRTLIRHTIIRTLTHTTVGTGTIQACGWFTTVADITGATGIGSTTVTKLRCLFESVPRGSNSRGICFFGGTLRSVDRHDRVGLIGQPPTREETRLLFRRSRRRTAVILVPLELFFQTFVELR